MAKIDSKSTTYMTLSYYWDYTRNYLKLFLAGSIGAALATIVQNMIPPLVVAKIFSLLQKSYTNHQKLHFSQYLPYLITYSVAMLLGVLFWRLQSFSVWKYEVAIRRDMTNDIHAHIQSQSQEFHANHFGGSLVTQTNRFASSYERLMDDFIWNIVPSVVTVVVAIAVLSFIYLPYALILLVIIVLYLVSMSFRVRKQLPFNEKVAALESKQTGALADSITNIATVRAFAGEKHESRRFAKATGATYDANEVLSLEILKSEALSHIQTNTFQIVAIFSGIFAITTLNLNVSLLYILLSYTQSITNQLWQFSRLIRNVNRSLGDAVEMTNILNTKPNVTDPENPIDAKLNRGEVIFKDVDFAYPENTRKPLFKDFNLKIKPGEKVGLVGPSGGGKSTISQLILRFMDINNGNISIDGHDIAKLRLADLRSRISYVAQEPILFHRSLAENIAYGDHDADQQTIEAVAKMAHAHEFIEALPHGYDTLVGERGVKLSGGQRQRIAIARSMLKNAPILILDEATSALDSESEALIQDALWKLMENRTAIIIAHRLSTIQKMDRIVVLEKGKIVESGSHKDLIKQNGTYAALWTRQSGGFIEDDEDESS